MRDLNNINALIDLPIDYMGFIFHDKSPRFVSNDMIEILNTIDFKAVKKVGVFVNETIEYVLEKAAALNLHIVQLHGEETPQYLMTLRNKNRNLEIWKAFSIDETFDFQRIIKYKGFAHKFLFDTKTANYGGSGLKFDWSLLKKYTVRTPFFLSGGISPTDTEGVNTLKHNQFHGLDLNSKFETEPAVKDVNAVKKFIQMVK